MQSWTTSVRGKAPLAQGLKIVLCTYRYKLFTPFIFWRAEVMVRPKSSTESAPVGKEAAKTVPTSSVKPAAKTAVKSASVGAKKATSPAATNSPAKVATAAPAKSKPKLVRDSFTIPKTEYTVLESLKARAANLKRPVKKSELLRAGIGALNGMGDKAFLAILNAVPSLKTGRPGRE